MSLNPQAVICLLSCVFERPGVHRTRIPEPLRLIGHAALASTYAAYARTRFACAAPPPSLTLTGERRHAQPAV